MVKEKKGKEKKRKRRRIISLVLVVSDNHGVFRALGLHRSNPEFPMALSLSRARARVLVNRHEINSGKDGTGDDDSG